LLLPISLMPKPCCKNCVQLCRTSLGARATDHPRDTRGAGHVRLLPEQAVVFDRRYADQEQLLADLGDKVIRPAELKVRELRG
jgi:hypothetical protein